MSISCVVWNASKYEVFLVRIFPHSDWIRRDTKYLSVFSLNAGKYGSGKTPYLDTFHAVTIIANIEISQINQILKTSWTSATHNNFISSHFLNFIYWLIFFIGEEGVVGPEKSSASFRLNSSYRDIICWPTRRDINGVGGEKHPRSQTTSFQRL